ncbi:hypothetical protein RI129_001000 [Pyrocoelia pectoralis]|uniref:BESS domain-containing protein n=1 Tax=Pyrocoelia pectoralis TaxID=417401 RepID=A0AAN7ZWR3_9COLE
MVSIFFLGDSILRRLQTVVLKRRWFRSGNGKLSSDLCVGGQSVSKLRRRIMSSKKPGSPWYFDPNHKADVRNNWKNLRQEFGKKLKKNGLRSGDAAPDDLPCQWPFFTKLLFLTDQFTPRETSSNIMVDSQDPNDDDIPNPSPSNASDNEDSLVQSPIDVFENSSRSNTPINPSRSSASRSSLSVSKTEKEKLDLKRKMASVDRNDEDVGFFNSLLPTVKTLAPKDKFIFRMKVQQTLFELAFREEQVIQRENSDTTNTNAYDAIVEDYSNQSPSYINL